MTDDSDPNNPYWTARAQSDRDKLRAIWDLCDEADAWNASDADTWFLITSERLRDIIRKPMP